MNGQRDEWKDRGIHVDGLEGKQMEQRDRWMEQRDEWMDRGINGWNRGMNEWIEG